jgi:hypothetical protein
LRCGEDREGRFQKGDRIYILREENGYAIGWIRIGPVEFDLGAFQRSLLGPTMLTY